MLGVRGKSVSRTCTRRIFRNSGWFWFHRSTASRTLSGEVPGEGTASTQRI